jgi:calcineurin-like phosphoesterase family protein
MPLSRPARRTWVAVTAAVLVVAPLGLLSVVGSGRTDPGGEAGITQGMFLAVADGYVSARYAKKSYGGAPVLRTDAAPAVVRSYLRFRVDGLAGPVRSATLRVFAESGSRNGVEVRGVADTGWEERTLHYATAPPVQSTVDSIGPIKAGTWVTADVTALVKGNGDVGMALVALGTSAIRYASREAGARAPQLVVESGTVRRPAAAGTGPVGAATAGEVVVAAAGDIACHPEEIAAGDRPCRQGATAGLLAGMRLDAVLPLGDLQYRDGDLASFQAVYHQTWGRFKAITRPAVGNHEYGTRGAAGYFSYFGAVAGDPAKGWYSYDLGSWHLIALNSQCRHIGGCGPGSPQERWLRADLAASPATCTLAYWHEPRFSSGHHGDKPELDALWRALHEAGAEIVMNGHDHNYERFAPQDPQGIPDDTRGIRQFVVGTGGANHRQFETIRPNSEVRNADAFGVLVLKLGVERYEWRFVPEPGKEFTDQGTGECH